MSNYTVSPIGRVSVGENGMFIKLDARYIPALQGLDGFSHIKTIYWFSELDAPEMRSVLESQKPYKNGPDILGIFATRSPVRPNPLAVSTSGVIAIDHTNGVIQVDYIDAHDGSPVLDIKPYTPSEDRITAPGVPEWCGNWPKSREESGAFDWGSVFNF